jgi:signal transduction histidine kinase
MGMEQAKAYLAKAREIFLELGAQHDLVTTQKLLGLPEPRTENAQQIEVQDQQTLAAMRKLSSLLQVCRSISAILNLEELLDQILDAAIGVVGAERGFLLLYEQDRLHVKVARGVEKEELQTKAFEFSRSLIGQVERDGTGVVTTDAQADPRFQIQESVVRYGLRSILCVPLKRQDKLLGVLYLDNRLVANLFTEHEMELMTAFASQAAIAIDNASAYQQITDLNVNLEAKVQQRTAQLARLNRELEESNKKLVELDRLKSQFLSHVSHELRTPLTSIKGFTENMRAGLAGPLGEKQDRYLERIRENTERLTRMIADLLDLSRIEAGKIELALGPVALPQAVGEVVEQLRPLAVEKRHRLDLHSAVADLAIRADRDRLSQILTNLIDNAIKYTPEGGSITVRIAQQSPRWAKISVIDTGVGIPAEALSRVFDPFFRAGHSIEGRAKGLGLGLSIVKNLVELHGGKVTVESAPSRGSAFHILLPASPST